MLGLVLGPAASGRANPFLHVKGIFVERKRGRYYEYVFIFNMMNHLLLRVFSPRNYLADLDAFLNNSEKI